ncbi:hypothetical protein IC229_33650 [Spirosoma sp. BT702]|uniref:Uncharacterized protein n=1 Tax=Spirosoma profusum TaxID=2771354 RepID=A0A927AWB0_9BACT|nr:hypothetical protein [Spirosoma profusum]MBD2705602.1 hypothetical protein [Spirosoma profusum]
MAIEQLLDIPRGSYVTLHCQTTDKPIYFCRDDDSGRKRFTPSAKYAHLSAIPYQVSGMYKGIEQEGDFVYMLVEYQGEGPVLRHSKYGIKIAGWEPRLKIAHVPIKAVRWPEIHKN